MPRLLPRLLLCVCLCSLLPLLAQANNSNAIPPAGAAFTPNAGQIIDDLGNPRPDVLFKSHFQGSDMYLRQTGFSYVFSVADPVPEATTQAEIDDPFLLLMANEKRIVRTYRMDLELLGANPAAAVEMKQATPGTENYYRGRDIRVLQLQSYREVYYREVYPKIDLRMYYTDAGLKYDFLVWPGGNPADIRMQYIAATDFRLQADGSMLATNPLGEVREDKPYSYQRTGKDRALGGEAVRPQREVKSQFSISGDVISFELENYDPKHLLVIDPGIVWATYYGGGQGDSFNNVHSGDDGSVVVVGTTSSSDFPTTPGSGSQTTIGGTSDAMIVKFNAERERVWATYFGGGGVEEGNSVWVDGIGNAHVVGSTTSDDFPLENPFQDERNSGTRMAFITQLSRTTGAIRTSTYFGGDGSDRAVDIDGRLVGGSTVMAICGSTQSRAGGFPLVSAEKTSKNQENDMFVARIGDSGRPLWSTFFGGTDDDLATGVAVDSEGNVTVVGWTRSDDVTRTAGGYQPDNAGGIDGLIGKFRISGGRTIWVSYLGTEGRDLVRDVAALPNNDNLMVFGETHHTSFPVLNGFQSTPNNINDDPGFADMFFFEMNKDGRQQWASLHGGDSIDRANRLDAFRDGSVAFCAQTNSDIITILPGAYREDAEDTLVAGLIGVINANRELVYSSYLFNRRTDFTNGVAAVGESAEDGNFIVVGNFTSDDMPATDNAFQNFVKGGDEGYIWEYGCNAFTEIVPDGPLEFCEGGSVELDAGEGFVEYTWSTGEKTQTILVEASGDYFVTVLDDKDCDFTTPPTAVSVFPIPEPIISADGPVELCDGATVTLDAGAGFESYKWSNDAETQTITVGTTDNYFVVVTGEGGCEAEASQQVTVRPTPVLTAQPAELDWGILDGCQSSVSLPLELTNTMGFPVRLSDLLFSNDAEFSSSNFAADMEIAPGATETLNIVFTPATLDPVSETLTIQISPCDAELVIPLTGSKGELLLTATPSNIDFGEVVLCDPNTPEQTIEFRNSGAEDVTLDGAQFNAPFVVVDQSRLPLTIAPGTTETLLVRFAPMVATPGVSNQLFIDYSSGTCNDRISVVLTGVARDAEITLVNNEGLAFPRVGDCDETADAELLLNVSANAVGPLQILSIDDVSSQVTAQAGLPQNLPVADLVRLPLRITPTTQGVIAGEATISYELDGCEGTLTFEYTGEKRGISITLPDEVDFGTYFGCEQLSLTRRVQIESEGADIFVSNVLIEGDFASTLVAGSPIPEFFDITFATDDPVATGRIVVVFTPCNIERVIELRGSRIDLNLSGPATADFGDVQIGTPVTQTFSWTNDGTGPLTIDEIDCLAAPFSLVAPANLPVTLEVGESVEVIVQFDAAAVGAQNGEVCLLSNSPCGLRFTTALRANGVDNVIPAAELEVYVEDLLANPHWPTFDIPLRVRALQGFDGDFDVEALAYVRLNSSVFFPRSLSSGSIENNQTGLGERSLVLRSGTVTLSEDAPLIVINGAPLLGDAVTSDIVIDSVVFVNRPVIARLENGSLTLDSLCEVGGPRLLTTRASFGIVKLTPNPSSRPPELQVRGVNGAPLQLLIRSATGHTVFRREWSSTTDEVMTVIPEMELAPGVYQAVLRSEFLSDEGLFVIVR